MINAGEELAQQFRAEHANDIEGTREALERCANMLNTYAPDLYPAGENGQVGFARAMMESVADEINAFLRATPEDARDRVIREQAREIAELRTAKEKLQAFKDWVDVTLELEAPSLDVRFEAWKRAAELTEATEPGGEKGRGRTLDG